MLGLEAYYKIFLVFAIVVTRSTGSYTLLKNAGKVQCFGILCIFGGVVNSFFETLDADCHALIVGLGCFRDSGVCF